MIRFRLPMAVVLAAFVIAGVADVRADNAPAGTANAVGGIAPKPLFDRASKDAASAFVIDPQSAGQASVTAPASGNGVDVTILPGSADYPGVGLKPQGAASWDLSPFGDIQATVTNTSTKKASICMRVDNDGDWHNNPWSNEEFDFEPGETKTIKVIFGYSYGYKPGYALKSDAIIQVLLYSAEKVSGGPLTFHIDSIEAGGVAGEKPATGADSIRMVPPDGYLLGPGATVDAATQLSGTGGASGTVVDSANGPSLKLAFPPGKETGSVTLKPAEGHWDLRDYLELRVKVRNDGKAPITPSAVAASGDGGPDNSTETIAANAPLAPGAETEIVVPFANSKTWSSTHIDVTNADDDRHDPGTGNSFTNNSGATVTVSAPGSDAAQSLTVESIRADRPAYSAPDWLGQRPPVNGDWTKTFDEEFDGPAFDESKWNLCSANYWDDLAHITRQESAIVNGKAVLRYEKKPGYADDDTAKKKKTDYAAGYIDTYGKWVQRYGYWEARMKLPKSPGLWPAYWLMPDRGASYQGDDRSDTGHGGMEFDILEYLSGWGPCRFNIAMHWDGYDKDHKSTGSEQNYFQSDKEGYVTAGLLWLPGKAVYYCNGREILRFENKRVSTVPSYIILDIVQGGWDNLPLEDAKLPDDFIVDYVRVWQRKDLASAADGYVAPPSSAPAKSLP